MIKYDYATVNYAHAIFLVYLKQSESGSSRIHESQAEWSEVQIAHASVNNKSDLCIG